MKLYNGKTIKQQVNRIVAARSETRDAVLWDIDTISQVCRVKIQGSPNLITAHFPRNWQVTPYWLKRGNAVSVRHRSGVRGYVEVTGEGRAIPSPVSGSALPDQQGLSDMILTGCELIATTPASMEIIATSGTYRIDGVEYTFSSTGLEIDEAPTTGLFRYDLCSVGIDGVLDYHPGVASANPQKPVIDAADHLQVGKYILVRGGVTVIENGDIGMVWSELYAALLLLTYDNTHEWSEADPETTRTIKVEIKDQYENFFSVDGTLELELKWGTGQIYSGDTGWNGVKVEQELANMYSYTFTYKRDQEEVEHSPVVFLVTLRTEKILMTSCYITLLDENGEPILL